MKSCSLLGLLVALATVTLVMGDDEVIKAISYNADTFRDQLAKENHFVMFYAPWCGHCKRLHPTWEELAGKYNGNDEAEVKVVIAKVDCTVETALCSDQDVTGYPTLKFFKSDEEDKKAEKYRGPRDIENLVKFIHKKMGLTVEEEKKEAIFEPEIAKADKGLYVLNERSFANHIKSGDHFVKFYAPWCGHCQKLAPTWDDLAKDMENDKVVKIGKLDCTAAQSVCQDNEVRGYPTLAYFRDGKKVETYRGARTLGELKDFLKSMQEESGKATEEKEKPEKPEKRNVLMLNKDNFANEIKTGVTFVKFFAPWCGHCKRLAPTWDQLADKFADNEGVKIAKVDCTSDENKNKELCNDQGVNGFPTLNIYKNGEKSSEYNGKRDLDALVEFVEKQMKTKDEL